jgi:hypothetical protein
MIEITFPLDSSSFALRSGYRGSFCAFTRFIRLICFIPFTFQIIIRFYFIILDIVGIFPIVVLLVQSIVPLLCCSPFLLIYSSPCFSACIRINQQ